MTKSLTPKSRPTSEKAENKSTSNLYDPRKEFIGAALSMSWQLAIVVLVPIVGGSWLDSHFKTGSLWTIIGFVVAVLATFGILYRILQQFNGKSAK